MRGRVQSIFAGICLAFLIGPYLLHAQVRVGLTSPKLQWKQIETPDYQVIFPHSREADARRVATLLDQIITVEDLVIGTPSVKIPIILQNQTVIPNGFVSVLPWRSELQLNPPHFQFAGNVPWIDLLTVHEYRHAQQITQARHGAAGKLLRAVFGKSGWAFNYSAIQPRWFLEGDAVYAETVHTHGGRGRAPDFEKEYRALLLSLGPYGYEKASFWSFKDFVPSHYHLGYFMTTYGRREFGKDLWEQVLQETYSKPGLYRFSKALKQQTGHSTKSLYRATMVHLDSVWKAQEQKISPTPGQLISSRPKKVYTSYRFPNYLNGQSVIAQRSSLREIRTLVKIEKGVETKLTRPGLSLGESYDVGGGKVVWSEIRFHPRWYNQTYSNIIVYDLRTGVKRKLTSKAKLQVPAISPDGRWIAAVQVDPSGSKQLVILSADHGQERQRYEIEPHEFVSFPRWRNHGEEVVVSVRTLEGNFIRSYSAAERRTRDLMIPLQTTIDRLFPHGKFVYFSSALTGVQNIFALNAETAEIFQLTDTRFGAFDPAVSPDGDKLIFSEYSAMGYELREIHLKEAIWKQSEFTSLVGSDYFGPLLAKEVGNITNVRTEEQHEVQPFRHLTKGLVNIHSWYPFATTEEFGFGILSNNLLSTLAVAGQFTYNTNEDSWKTSAQLSYGAFFPILDVDVTTGERQIQTLVSTTDTMSIIGYGGGWKEHSFAAGIRLPFNVSHGNYFSTLTFRPSYRHFVVNYFDPFTDRARDGDFGSMDLELVFGRSQISALQNILPRWAQSISFNYQRTLGNSENQGEIFTVNASSIFPGIFPNHSLYFTGGYQTEDIVDAYRFEDVFTNARGYGSRAFERVYRVSANYTLPLWYPDLPIGSLAYFKRLRSNMFYDYSEGRLLGFDRTLRSFGVELITDFRLVRLVDVALGVRLGRQIDADRNFVEFVLSSIQF